MPRESVPLDDVIRSMMNHVIIFMEKKDKNNPLRLVINYYGLNDIIILVRYPISLINKL